MQLAIFLYTFSIMYSIMKGYYIVAIGIALTIPLALLAKKQLKEYKIKYFTRKIEEAKNANEKGLAYKPFLNVNREKWYIIELIPFIERITAKRVANSVRRKKFKNVDEFAVSTGLDSSIRELIKKIVKF